MKINTDSNIYIFLYSSVLVLIVAAVLAFTAVKLQPLQEHNVKVEKMQNILKSIGIESTPKTADSLFKKVIKREYAVNSKGDIAKENGVAIEGEKAFNINLKTQFKEKLEDKKLPVFEATLEDGSKLTVIPLRGKGLWGPIWGYISLKTDFNTIYGAVFDHKGETPGLGAEIKKDWFEEPFKGKKLFDGDKLVSITCHKGGKGAAKAAGDTEHGVDAISGGTITSKGLERMFKEEWLFAYKEFLLKNKK